MTRIGNVIAVVTLVSLFAYVYGGEHGDFFFNTQVTTPHGAGGTEDIILVEDPDCQELDTSGCPETDPNVFISPRVSYPATPQSPTTLSPSISPGSELEAPCLEDDDEDCNGSGSGMPIDGEKSTESDKGGEIIIDVSNKTPPTSTNSTPNDILVTVDFTDKPQIPRRNRTTPVPGVGAPPPTTPPGGTSGGGISGSSGQGKVKEKIDRGGTALGRNIGLIIGIAVGVVLLLLVIAFAFYKYKSRDEGSYKIDENKLSYSYETCNTKPPPQVNGGVSKSGSNCSKSKKKDVKEWYV